MESKEIIQRIPEHYVEDDYFQIMLGYQHFMALLDNEDFKYVDWPNMELINTYIDDKRKDKFPYSNIPIHKQRILFKKYNMVNQLLSFETPYLFFSSKCLRYYFALKDGNDGLLISSIPKINPDKHKEIFMTCEELTELLSLKERQLIYINGKWCHSLQLWEQNKLLESYKAILLNRIKRLEQDDILIDAININMIDKIPASHITLFEPFLLIAGNENGTLSFLKISFKTSDGNIYNVSIDEIELPKYSLLQVKNMSNAIYINSKEPKISRILNPNISSAEIEKAKTLVLTRKNNIR